MCGRISRMFAAFLLVVSAMIFARAVFGVGSGWGRRLVRAFAKHIFNPFMLWVAARRHTYYAVLHHVGRRSGRVYVTPVVAKLTSNGVLIPLPYGAGTDWCRNVLAASGCTLTLDGQDYALTSPAVIPASEAEPLLPPKNVQVWRRVGIRNYLSLKLAASATSGVTETVQTAAA
jgi:hypothetical protein